MDTYLDRRFSPATRSIDLDRARGGPSETLPGEIRCV